VPGRRDGRVRVERLRAETVPAGGARGALGLAGAARVSFRVRHAGNVRYARLHAVVELLAGGRVRESRPVELGTLLPGGLREARVELPLPGWSPGGRRVRVRVGALPEARAETTVSVGAARLYAAGGLALGLVGLAGAGIARRGRRAR
jgi:hypothetical protein